MSAASVAFRPSGLVQATPLPAAAAARTASRWRWLGSETTTRSTSGSVHTAWIESAVRLPNRLANAVRRSTPAP